MSRAAALVSLFVVLAAAGGAARQVALSDHTDAVLFVRFLPDGKTLLSGSADRTIRLWEVPEGRARAIWQRVPEFDAAPSTTVIALSGNGALMARAGAAQGTAEIWDVGKTENTRTIQAHRKPVLAVALSRDGSLLVTSSEDEIRTWDVASGRGRTQRAAPNLYRVAAIAAGPDGRTFALATTDGALGLYDSSSGASVMQFEGVPGRVRALDFSPDGRRLASGHEGSAENSVRVWDVAQASAVQQVIGPPNYASAVAFSPDGRRLASAGVVVSVWDTEAGQATHKFEGHTATVRSLAFSPDGSQLASAADDHVIGLWTLNK